MSYDIDIVDENGDVIHVEERHNLRGGTYQAGGTTELSLNITYNYSKFYSKHIDSENGIRWLYGKKVGDTIPALLIAILKLEEEEKDFVYNPGPVHDSETLGRVEPPKEDDYWAPTPKNAKKALQDLVALGALAPSGIWAGD